MSGHRLALVLLPALWGAGCGAALPGGPTLVETPADVTLVVFYDENGNGRLDAGEEVRVGNVQLQTPDGQLARSEPLTGRAILRGLTPGSYEIRAQRLSLPPYFRAPMSVLVDVPVPGGGDVAFPLTLPIGRNEPNTYMAFGDSITLGDGSSDREGYRGPLEAELQGFFGRAEVLNQGIEGTRSDRGADRLVGALGAVRPAHTLIVYGTNDWNDYHCKQSLPCFTVDSLRAMLRSCRAAQSLPFLATIIPANPADPRTDERRNNWVHAIDALIRPMAAEEGAVIVDLEAAFLAEGALPPLFSDHVHPNDRGYAIMAREFFKAITTAEGASGASSLAEPFAFEIGPRHRPSSGAGPSGATAPAAPRSGRGMPERSRPRA